MKDIVYWAVVIWLYGKLLGWLKLAVFPWLYKITFIFGMIWPKGHDFLYQAPFRSSGNLLIDLIMYVAGPITIIYLLVFISYFYVALYTAAEDEIRDGNTIGFVGHFSMLCMVFVLQLYFLWQGPTLVY